VAFVAKILAFDWALYFQWIVATTLGWLLGGFLFDITPLLWAGVAVGFLQWFVLQGRIPLPWRWFLATAAGWVLGYFLVLLGVPVELEPLNGIVLGLTTGVAQWLLLRKELSWAGWWVAFSVMGWTTGLALLPGILLTGIMAGALTGIALEVLLRTPKRS
jgi:hypothetical protein